MGLHLKAPTTLAPCSRCSEPVPPCTVLIEAPHGMVLAPLAADRFCSGHLVWVQQAARPLDCIAVHATFTEFGDAGKRWRFIEAGLWAPLAPRYFNEGHYLTFEPPQPPADPAPCPPTSGPNDTANQPESCGGGCPRRALPGSRVARKMARACTLGP